MSLNKRDTGNDPAARFAASLEWQEAQRWAEYLEHGTRKALDAWRAVRQLLRQQRAQLI